MQTTEDVRAVAQAWIDNYNNKDFEGLREIFDDNVQLSDLGLGISVQGADALVEGMRAVAEERIPDRRSTPERIIVEGNIAVIQGSWRGTPVVETWGKPPGTVLKQRSCTVLEIEGGRIRTFTDYTCHEK